MKEDYLWDKSGSEPEIEHLESLLSRFRYSDSAAPASNVIEFPARVKTVLRPWILAMAACIAVAAVGIATWNLISIGGSPTSTQTSYSVENHVAPLITPSPKFNPDDDLELKNSMAQYVAAKRRNKTIPRHKYFAIARKLRQPSNHPLLSKEEKYAYGQLMLALSITSSKLQIVQDSINGVDDIKSNNR